MSVNWPLMKRLYSIDTHNPLHRVMLEMALMEAGWQRGERAPLKTEYRKMWVLLVILSTEDPQEGQNKIKEGLELIHRHCCI